VTNPPARAQARAQARAGAGWVGVQPRAAGGELPAYAAVLASVVLWGLAPVATRYLVLVADPVGVLGLRFALCGLCYLVVLPWLGLRPARRGRHWLGRRRWSGVRSYGPGPAWTRRSVLAVLGCGLTGIVGYNLFVTLGIRHVPAGLAGILLATEPIWIALLSVAFLGHRLTPPLRWGIGLAFAGVALLGTGEGLHGALSATLAGSALILLGTLMWAVYSVAVGPLARDFGTLRISALTLLAGAVPLVALAGPVLGAAAGQLGSTGWLVLVLYALGPNLAGILLWNYGLSRLECARAGLLLYLYPVVSVAGGGLLLAEPVTVAMLAGGALVLLGLVVAQRRPRATI
jgi:drug/metabolite transporter (DMT)-like permease